MKTLARLRDILINNENKAVVQFVVSDPRAMDELNAMNSDKTYTLEVKEVRSARSLNQNALLWELIGKIDKAINGSRSNDELSIYIDILEDAGANYTYIGALPETEDDLRKAFRAVKKIKPIDLNGKDGYMFKCFIGSSKMDKKEMAMVIDSALDRASRLGITTDYYEEMLRN